MKPNELMIGDWVLCDKNAQSDYEFDNVNYQPYQIQNGEDIDYAIERNMMGDADVYQPIPLTVEVIDKLSDIKELVVLWDDRKTEETGENWYEVSINCDNGNTATITLRYVHELQHALRLCGVEKEIEI